MDMPHHPEPGESIFLGRERELGELCDALAAARAGQGRLLLLCGEPGIGKTALIEHLARRAAAERCAVAWGRCWESGGAPPFWPWVQVLRHCLRGRDAPDVQPGIVDDLAQIVPDLRQQAGTEPAVASIAPEQGRFRLFESVVSFFRSATARQPLLVLLDDLHWADEASLLLLCFIARELRGASLLIVGTYRRGPAALSAAVSALLARAAREGRTLALAGLGAEEVRRFVWQQTHRQPAERMVAEIQRLTEGNPLFVEEVVHLLQAQRRRADDEPGDALRVPESVRDVIRRRLAIFAGETRAVLASAAVLGREFDLTILERMTGDAASEQVTTAVTAGILLRATGPVERYRFTHALIAETLYADIAAAARVELHRRAAAALLAHWGPSVDDHLDEVAHHFSSAAAGGDVEAAVDWAERAGIHSLGRLAFEAAANSFAQALQAMRSASPSRHDPQHWVRRRVDVLIRLGTARARAGDLPGANAALLEAVDRARDLDDPPRFAAAVLALCSIRVERGRADPDHVALLEEGIARLGTGTDALRARLLARLASASYLMGPSRAQADLSLEAVALARHCGDRGALANALAARHSICWEGGSSRERLDLATEIVRLAQEAGDDEAALEGQGWRVFDLLELGEIAAADSAIALYEQRAHDARLPRQRWYASVFRTMQALLRGRFADAERLAASGLGIRQADGAPPSQFYAVQMFTIRREQGRLGELQPAVRALAQQYPDLLAWQCAMALFHAAVGDREAAQQHFDRLAACAFQNLPRDVNWLPALSMLAEVCGVLGDAQRAQALYTLLQPCAGRNVVVVGAVACRGAVDYFLGLLAATMKRRDAAVEHFTRACDLHQRMQAWPLVAHAQFQLARALLGQNPDRKSRAAALADQALATAHNLGMSHLEQMVGTEITAALASVAASFRRDGDHWAVRFGDAVVRLKDNRGCVYIAYLLARPGQPVPASELLAAAGAAASSDEQARVAVRKAVTIVLRSLGGRHDSLRQHLAERLHTGRLCSYTPAPGPVVAWDLEPQLR